MRVGNVVDIFFMDGSVVMNELGWGEGGRLGSGVVSFGRGRRGC
jgi:hypothetical protein